MIAYKLYLWLDGDGNKTTIAYTNNTNQNAYIWKFQIIKRKVGFFEAMK